MTRIYAHRADVVGISIFVGVNQDAHCLHFLGYQQMALDAKVLKTLANVKL